MPRESNFQSSGITLRIPSETDMGGDTFRLIGFFEEGRLLVLTSGFAKKTEKIPRQEIALAEKRRQDYKSRRQQP
jgi:phage-related protein